MGNRCLDLLARGNLEDVERAILAAALGERGRDELSVGDGANQSMAVVPLAFMALGSTTTRALPGSAERSITASIGCCLGGWLYIAKSEGPARLSP
jgi:hypothetical protein